MSRDETAALILGLFLGAVIGVFIAGIAVKAVYESEAIDNGAACYDQKTGHWQWIKREELKK